MNTKYFLSSNFHLQIWRATYLIGFFLWFALTTAYGQLQVNGRSLYDDCGEEVVFRGVENVIHDQRINWANDPYGTYIDDIAATGTNAIRIIGGGFSKYGGPATLDDILDRCINKHNMWVSIAHVDWDNAEIRNVIKKYENFVSLHAQGEVNHNDDQKWANDSKAVIDRFRGWGFKCPIELMTNEYGQNADVVLERGGEVFNHDPEGNVIFGVQIYSKYGDDPRYKIDELANFDHFVQIGVSLFTIGLRADWSSHTTETYKRVWNHAWEKGFSTFYWDFYGGDGDNISCDGTINCLTDVGRFLINNSQYNIGATAQKSDFLVDKTCSTTPPPPPPTTTGNVTVRARGTTGSEQIEIRYNDQRVGDRITLSTTYQEYKVQVNNANGNFKVAFVNDGGNRDVYVDWLQVGATKRQAESRDTNTGAWANGVCGGGTRTEVLHCNGYIGFGTMSDVTSGNVVIRARGNCGSETMILEVGGSNVKTWNNLGTSYANYTYSGYSGGTIKVKFTNNQSSPCDRNLYLDYIEVCGKRIQSESASVVQTSDWTNGDKQILFTDGNNNYGNPGCGSARTSSTGTKLVAEPAASEWGEVFNLYPNPATDQLTVEGGEDYQVTLYDLTGRKVMQHDHLKGASQLNISHVRPGLYVVKMRDGEQREVRQRIVIE